MKKQNKTKQTSQKEIVILCIIAVITLILFLILKLVFFVTQIPQYEEDIAIKQNAIKNAVIQECDNIQTSTIKRDCFTEVFETHQDINSINVTTFCQENVIDVEYCFYGFALAQENEYICSDIKKINNNIKISRYCQADVLLKRQGSQITSYLD